MRDFSPFNTPFDAGMFGLVLPFIVAIALVTIVLKGFALWYAARSGQKYWFIALLVINTVGILEVIYLLFFRLDAPYKHVAENVTKNAPPAGSSSPSA